jgi:hypothetical protein
MEGQGRPHGTDPRLYGGRTPELGPHYSAPSTATGAHFSPSSGSRSVSPGRGQWHVPMAPHQRSPPPLWNRLQAAATIDINVECRSRVLEIEEMEGLLAQARADMDSLDARPQGTYCAMHHTHPFFLSSKAGTPSCLRFPQRAHPHAYASPRRVRLHMAAPGWSYKFKPFCCCCGLPAGPIPCLTLYPPPRIHLILTALLSY